MPGVYDRQREQARRLIAEKGQVVAWRSLSNTTPADVDQPWKPGADDASPPEYNVSIVFLPPGGGAYNSAMAAIARTLGAKEIATGTLSGLMAPDDRFIPDETDVVRRLDPRLGTIRDLHINTLDLLAPNGEPILYTIGFAE